MALNVIIIYCLLYLLLRELADMRARLDTHKQRLDNQVVKDTLILMRVFPESRDELLATLPEDWRRLMTDPRTDFEKVEIINVGQQGK